MANLSTLNGIAQAREDLYNKLEAGTIDERRALGMERLLRGQQSIKADVPTRLLGILIRSKGASQMEYYGTALLRTLHKFTTGEELPAFGGLSGEPEKKSLAE